MTVRVRSPHSHPDSHPEVASSATNWPEERPISEGAYGVPTSEPRVKYPESFEDRDLDGLVECEKPPSYGDAKD